MTGEPLDVDSSGITNHCFKDSVTMVTNSINTKAINLLLSTSCTFAFNPTYRTSLLKIREDHIFERACFVLSSYEFLTFGVIVPFSIQSSRHWLTHPIGIELVYADIWLAQFSDLRIKVSSTTALRVKTKKEPPTIFARIFTNKSLSLSLKG